MPKSVCGKDDFGHFRSPKNHDDSMIAFDWQGILVFSTDLRLSSSELLKSTEPEPQLSTRRKRTLRYPNNKKNTAGLIVLEPPSMRDAVYNADLS